MVEKLDQRCVAITADVRDTAEINGRSSRAVSELGKVDILLAIAGVLSLTTVADMTDEQWHDVVDTDLTGVFKAIRAVIPSMVAQNYGRIIATSSMAGRTGLPTVAHYCAAKWGVIGLVKSVAREVAANGVTVNCVCPTNTDTDMIHNAPFYGLFAPGVDNPTKDDVIPGFTSLNAIPVPWIETIDISNAMMFLASDEARYITGRPSTCRRAGTRSTRRDDAAPPGRRAGHQAALPRGQRPRRRPRGAGPQRARRARGRA